MIFLYNFISTLMPAFVWILNLEAEALVGSTSIMPYVVPPLLIRKGEVTVPVGSQAKIII